MDTILIVCGAGASSTFLASRMRAIAASRGQSLVIQAANQSDIESRLPGADVLLVGPHLAPVFAELTARAKDCGVAAALLPPTAFAAGGAEDAFTLASGLLPSGRSETHTLTKGISHG